MQKNGSSLKEESERREEDEQERVERYTYIDIK